MGTKTEDILLKPDFYFEDDRGKLVQLFHEGYEQVNVLISHKGVNRGGHYHKVSNEAFFIVKGQVELTIKDTDGNKRKHELKENDFFRVSPYQVHSMYFPEDCIMIGMYDICVEKADGSKDIYPDPEED